MRTTFIGGGNMATALIGGLVARGAPVADLRVVEPDAEARAGSPHGIRVSRFTPNAQAMRLPAPN